MAKKTIKKAAVKKAATKKTAAKTAATKNSGDIKIDNINVRMYRVGTGDFFLLQFRKAKGVHFKLMIDCGCIDATKGDFDDHVDNLATVTGGEVDLLVVTHEHTDHINGFEKTIELFDQIVFKQVWFAWTEENETFANDFRKEHTEKKRAINAFAKTLANLEKDPAFVQLFQQDFYQPALDKARAHFITQINAINRLNSPVDTTSLNKIPTMEDKLRKWKVIKEDTEVKFMLPGQVEEKLPGIEGIRIFVMGPPRNNDFMKLEEKKGEGYEKREKQSTLNMAHLDKPATTGMKYLNLPFEDIYICPGPDNIQKVYQAKDNQWRNIDYDWMYSIGSIALRHESSINNTSLSLAIQFKESERILLFPGDAEHGHWLSWYDEKLKWKFKDLQSKQRRVDINYILENTIFYKVSHHLSQNGTLKQNGIDKMPDDDLVAMVTLDLATARSGWRNTMPNDLLGAELMRKTRGKVYFLGNRKRIMKNIETNRVSVSQANKAMMEKLNKKFDGELFLECEVIG